MADKRNLSYEGRFSSKLAEMGLAVTDDDVTIDGCKLTRNENVTKSDWLLFWGSLERKLVCRPAA